MPQSEWEKYCDDVYRDAIVDGKSARGAQLTMEAAQIEAVEVDVTTDRSRAPWDAV